MTRTLLVGYDLNKSGQNYTELIEVLESDYESSWHELDSTWIIKTSKTCVQVRDDLLPLIDDNDELLVVELTGAVAGCGFTDEATSWLQNNL